MKSLNHRLVITAVALGGISLLLAAIAPEGWREKNETPNFIGVVTLAEKIKGRENLKVIDIRSKERFEEFHLPTAINIPIDEFSGFENFEKTSFVFYSGDDWLTRRFWNSLNHEERSHCMILYGGIYDWYDKILYPKLPVRPHAKDTSLVEKVHKLMDFYGGHADFVRDPNVMNIYKTDLSDAPWPKPSRMKGLVRKGC